jgi:hypothetical protein
MKRLLSRVGFLHFSSRGHSSGMLLGKDLHSKRSFPALFRLTNSAERNKKNSGLGAHFELYKPKSSGGQVTFKK